MSDWLNTLGQAIASKAMVDKIEIPERYYKRVDDQLSELEHWSGMLANVETDKPHTWFRSGLSIMRELSVPMEKTSKIKEEDPYNTFLNDRDLKKIPLNSEEFQDHLSGLCFDLSDKGQTEAVLETGEHTIYRYPIPGKGVPFYFSSHASGQEDPSTTTVTTVDGLIQEGDQSEAVKDFLAESFWEGKEVMKVGMDFDGEAEIEMSKVNFDGRKYKGVLTVLYDRLKKYLDNGTRRSVLFQGPPGTGKSTLAYNIAERVSDRTVVLSHSVIEYLDMNKWSRFLSYIQPEMILIDDIDRFGHDLDRNLDMFEDKYCEAPLIIFTSNDYSKLPLAFKRPGRIDQMIRMNEPPEEIRHEVIQSLGEQENVDIPEERIPYLDMIYQRYPGAYIVELIRRCKVEGWDYKIPEWGLTFEKLDPKVIQAWNGEIDIEEVEEGSRSDPVLSQGGNREKRDNAVQKMAEAIDIN